MSTHTEQTKCRQCGGLFTPRAYNQIFCSAPCRVESIYAKMRKPAIIKKCAECGSDFKTHTKVKIYCCRICTVTARNRQRNITSGIALKKNVEATCKGCGNTFTRYHHNQLYCTRSCQYRAGRQSLHYDPKKCDVCGNEFTPKSSNATTCSSKCREDKALAFQRKKSQLEHAALRAAYNDNEE